MKLLVTGGAGFIGSHIVDKLIDLGHQVVVIDNESSQSYYQFYFNPKATYYKLDIVDYENTRPLYDGVDYVFHCAAESRIQSTLKKPIQTAQTNVVGTTSVLQCSLEAGVKKVIYSSTSSAYGLKNTPPLQESMIEDCLNVYSVSKVTAEKICTLYTKLYGLDTIIFRYFNVYGDREPLRGPYALVVGKFLNQFKNGESLTIVSDGTQRRDFTHVEDVVNANILAMTVNHNRYGEVFNIGSGVNYSILELADMISNDIVMIDPRISESYITLADNSKAKDVLGWVPTKNIKDYVKEKVTKLRLLDQILVV